MHVSWIFYNIEIVEHIKFHWFFMIIWSAIMSQT